MHLTPAYICLLTLLFFFCSLLMTRLLIYLGIKKNILDIPNQRSAHTCPTPRVGGLSIVLLTLAVCILLNTRHTVPYLSILIGSTAIVAIIGICDDIYHIHTAIRAFCYLSAATLFILLTHGIPDLISWDLAITVLSILGIAWLTNLYNFMDGADGIAGIQTITVTVPIGLILYQLAAIELSMLCLTIGVSTLGFLIWNWPPAKIFMGDIGSCSIGFLFGCLMFITYQQGLLSLYIWLSLLSFFIVDASLTLLKRLIDREKWYQAHCSHAYQRYLQIGYSHRRLAILVSLFNLGILWPITYLIYRIPEIQHQMTVVTYLSLGILWCLVQKKYILSRCK